MGAAEAPSLALPQCKRPKLHGAFHLKRTHHPGKMSKPSDSQEPITYQPIGVIHSPHQAVRETPIQPIFAQGIAGTAEVFAEYAEGLRDLEGFSHIYLIYHFHRAPPARLTVKPFLDDTPRGVFATRAPSRPNPIGFSLVRLVRREGHILHLEDVDVLDGTPLLDIKPYVARFDHRENARSGWQEDVGEETAQVRGLREYGK
jgi:tRNA-Thr(GGU) m(6)t(6)A37 methyltransferase TsaA